MGPHRKLLWIAVGTAFVLAAYSAVDDRGFRRYLRLQQDAAALSAKNRALRDQNERMVGELAALRGSPAALERAAREELGFIRPGEIVLNLEEP
jgi:cell division protein FtsB